jgi:renalase
VDFDGAFLEGDPLSWVCRNTSKPGRPPEESWVLHGGPGWSETHLERDPEEVAEMLMGAFASRFGPLPDASFRRGHRWRYAQPRDAAGVDALHDARLGIGVCGDAFPGGRVEGALLSGRAVAGRILAQAPPAAANPLGEARPGTSEQLPLL